MKIIRDFGHNTENYVYFLTLTMRHPTAFSKTFGQKAPQ
jgi:hypothetical protein